MRSVLVCPFSGDGGWGGGRGQGEECFPSHLLYEWSLKCIAGNVSILQFLKACNVQFDLLCAFSCIRVMIQLSVWREVVTVAF